MLRSPEGIALRLAIAAALSLVTAAGCSRHAARKGGDASGSKPAGVVPQGEGVTAGIPGIESGASGPDGEAEASLRDKSFQASPELATIHFDYDRYELDDEAKKALHANAVWLKEYPGVEIHIEGHCDERGTTEYNIALGQHRASTVRDFYKQLGVRSNRMSTISYGEEKPECEDSTDECWRRNRRAMTLVRKK